MSGKPGPRRFKYKRWSEVVYEVYDRGSGDQLGWAVRNGSQWEGDAWPQAGKLAYRTGFRTREDAAHYLREQASAPQHTSD